MNPRDLNPTPKTGVSAPGTLPVPDPAEVAAGSEAQTLRSLAEAVKLMAEANESRTRQLRELEEIADWLRRGLVAEAARLRQLDSGGACVTPPATLDGPQAEAALLEQTNNRARQAMERLRAQLWPAALRGDAWRPWQEHLIERAASDGAAALLLARLHTAAALERAGKPLPLELARDLGRAVYEAGGDEADKLAQALTQASGGRFEIRVVRVGDRVDNKFMKPAASGLVEVRTVSSWAVRDQNGLWQFPAEVG